METEAATPYGGRERGAGGKLKRPPARKPPFTPYDRPLVIHSTSQGRRGGWLSKLVDPAYRLISGGATKLMPSLFSKSPSTSDILPSDTSDDGDRETEVAPSVEFDDCNELDPEISRSDRQTGPSKVVDLPKKNPVVDGLEQDNMKKSCDNSEWCKIEQLVKGKMFSRDEINRLMEILNSKVVPDNERHEETASLTAKGEANIEAPLPLEYPETPAEVKKDINRTVLRISSPCKESNLQNDVIASPVDIAKAYMGSRTSELGPSSYSVLSKSERALFKGDEFPTPSPSRPTCWPGAMVQDQHGVTTPLTQRGTFGFHNIPRTPYSRTIYSKSRSKLSQLQADRRSLNISSNSFQQPRTPIFGQVKSGIDVDNGYGSGGAIRRIRKKFASEIPSRGSASLYSLQKGPLQIKESNASKVFFPVKEKSMESAGTRGSSDYHPVDHVEYASEEGLPTPSPAVRGILEHLANKATPNDLAAELKIASSWKKSPSKDTDSMRNGNTNSTHLRGSFDVRRNTNDLNVYSEGTDDRGNSSSREKSHDGDAINIISKNYSSVNGSAALVGDASSGRSFGFKNVSETGRKSTDEDASLGAQRREKDTSQLWPLHEQVNGQSVMKNTVKAAGSELLNKQSSHFSGTKPTLKSISVNKPDPKHIISSDNGPGFTFPVSASGVLSEPPTPSIIPSFSSGGVTQSREEMSAAIPSYSFGNKESVRLDFSSFPSTSNASIHDDTSDVKFNFGSDTKTRVSFKSVGKDAICY